VAKLWPSLSVLLVLVMLLFLAPTLLLLPGQNVSAAGGNVVQAVEATFSFTETTNGTWWPFTAGSAGINATYGLGLTQYTRENVVRSTNLTGCGFRNYTTGNGSVSGVGLNGNISLAWNTFNFNQTYPDTPKYMTATHFGFMSGRGYIDEGGGDNFAFVFVADFDSDDATMSNAVGKGFMLSTEESGRFGNATSSDPADMHKIIGDFDITKSGNTYTGNFHLRNYDPSEVFDLGSLTVSGMVAQEPTDAINAGLELVNFTVVGPMSTPGAPSKATGFEDIAWGKDPIKTVTGGRLGPNGVMDISRNSPLYLEFVVGTPYLMVHIQGSPVCNLYIDDTNTGVRAGDGTPYGKLYELLLLSLPYQELPAKLPPEYFTQSGYTFTPFGLFNPSTDCYAGEENFADAFIRIQACQYDAMQDSIDHSYGLFPHPKVESVTPTSGYLGETLDVTIKGKYLLRADNFAAATGSVSLGSGITVNSYSIKNSSPIDNEITARITIDAAASAGNRTVNVTSCFNYTSGHGAAPYLSGELPDAFTVKALEGATLQGQGIFAAGANSEPFRVKLFEAGTNWNIGNLTWDGTAITSASGTFIISNLTAGTYDIGIKGATSLSRQETNVVLNSTKVVTFTVVKGDADDDDYIGGADFGLFSIAYDSWPGQPNWDPRCDFDSDDYVGGSDFGLFSMSYDTWGDLLGKVVF